ncbi:MAG: DUF5106 domain-containing protein, partial [Bacteroidetes bacterium]|nr:DUF5106 domain-containing protein [Bacteroidota bacterium]
MKKTINCWLIIFSLICFHLSTWAQKAGYDIQVNITNAQDTAVLLGYHFGNQKYVADTSSLISPGIYSFKGDKNLAPGVYFIYSPKIYFELVIAENQQYFEVTTDTTHFINSMQTAGSRENELFSQFQQLMAEHQKKILDLRKELENPDLKDSTSIRNDIAEVNKNTAKAQLDIINNNPDTFVAELISLTRKPQIPDELADTNDPDYRAKSYKYYKDHFFDHLDFSNDAFLRTPVFHSRVTEYLDKLTFPHPDSLARAAEFIIEKSRYNSIVFRYLVVSLTNKFETSKIMGMDAVFVYLAEKYYLTGRADWVDDEVSKKIEDRVRELKPNLIGNQAPAMQLLDTLLQPASLYNVAANYTVLFFYDPDCGHCKKVTPELLKTYHNSLKNQEVEILAIST